jgi:hypothetical protein
VAVTIRFHGRFVYAEREGGFSVLAPRFDAPFAPHQPLMSIAYDQLRFADDSVEPHRQTTTLHPMLRIATGGDGARPPQTLVWDLSGLRVSYSGSPKPATLGGSAEVLPLDRLEKARSGPTPQLDENARRLFARGRTSAVVEVLAGSGLGVTPADPEDKAKFRRAGDIKLAEMASRDVPGVKAPVLRFTPDPADPDNHLQINVAEWVDFTVQAGDVAGKKATPVLTLTFSNGGDEVVGRVTVNDGATVAFSNLCAPLHEPGVDDLEFSQYYALLEASPGDDGLVPTFGASALSESFPCVASAKVK